MTDGRDDGPDGGRSMPSIETEFGYGAHRPVPVRLIGGAFENGSAELTIDVGPEQWSTIDMIMLFHLEWGNRNEGEIVEGGDVRIEARMDAELIGELLAALDEFDPGDEHDADLAPVIASLAADHPLKKTEAWYGLRVTESVPLPPELAAKGEVRSGFTTIWSD